MKENVQHFKRESEGRSKSPNESPAHTPRKVLQKFNSLKVAPFKSTLTQDVFVYNLN